MQRTGFLKIVILASAFCAVLIFYTTQTQTNNPFFMSIRNSDKYSRAVSWWRSNLTDGELREYILESGYSHQGNPLLIKLVKKELMVQPPTGLLNTSSLGLNSKNAIPSNKEKLKMLKDLIIDESKPGFFIECGANDGEFISPTLPLEKKYNWTGLLIEANPEPFSKLAKKNRSAWLMNAAVCTTPFAKKVTFFTNPKNTGLAGLNQRNKMGVSVPLTVQCIPLYTMLAALNITEVDYFSLDVEGFELEILKTIPFDKVKFKFLTVEHWSIPGGRIALQLFMESKGYVFIKEVNDRLTRDSAFIHESLRHNLRNLRSNFTVSA